MSSNHGCPQECLSAPLGWLPADPPCLGESEVLCLPLPWRLLWFYLPIHPQGGLQSQGPGGDLSVPSGLRGHEFHCQHLCGVCPDVALAEITLYALKIYLLNEWVWGPPFACVHGGVRPPCLCVCVCAQRCEVPSAWLCVCVCACLCGTCGSFSVCEHFDVVCVPRDIVRVNSYLFLALA